MSTAVEEFERAVPLTDEEKNRAEDPTQKSTDEHFQSAENKEEPQQENVRPPERRLFALPFITIMAISCCTNQVWFKEAYAAGVSVSDYNLINAGVRVIVMAIGCLFAKINPYTDYPKGSYYLIFLRSAFGLITMFSGMWSIVFIPIAVNMVIMNTAPLWVGLFGYLLINEEFGIVEIISMILCFGLVAGIAFSSQQNSLEQDLPKDSYMIGALLAFVASVAIGGIQIAQRELMLRRVPITTLMMHISLTYMTACAIISLTDNAIHQDGEPFLVYHDVWCYLYPVIGGINELIFLIVTMIAMTNASAIFVSLIMFQTIGFAFLVDKVVYNYTVTGLPLILVLCMLCVVITYAVIKYRQQYATK